MLLVFPSDETKDEGHKRMAYIYYAAITRALRAGKVKEAADMEQTGSVNCDKVRGNGEFSRKFHGAPSSIYV